ncbi:SH3 domain-containing protein [Breznakiella homolactica]|uniref:SH3 domain-containing protein n=1 Tax=Breznakiella homolactica TaxID=2798577 RepID=A0A7T7XK03_9SPIR|nr:SH3 domain-containing protein [Breznakiella homolactica]QQO07647.1 SH3 domain-containing protein [Breznakiella homolactica]
MKKIITGVLLLCITVLLHSDIYEITDEKTEERYINTEDGLRLREEPSLGAGVIGIIPYDDVVVLYDQYSNEKIRIDNIESRWVKVFWGDTTGWVFDGYLSEQPSKGIVELSRESPLYQQVNKEFILAGLNQYVSKAEDVIRLFDLREDELKSNDGRLSDFENSDVKILFGFSRQVGRVTLISSKYATTRGLRVGDNISKLRQLYPGSVRDYNNSFFDEQEYGAGAISFFWSIRLWNKRYYQNRHYQTLRFICRDGIVMAIEHITDL